MGPKGWLFRGVMVKGVRGVSGVRFRGSWELRVMGMGGWSEVEGDKEALRDWGLGRGGGREGEEGGWGVILWAYLVD